MCSGVQVVRGASGLLCPREPPLDRSSATASAIPAFIDQSLELLNRAASN